MPEMGGWIDVWNESFQKAKDQVNSAWFMNENQKQQDHMFDRGLAADSSAIQRRVADLKAAGLNPMLAIRGGEGANTPSPGGGSQGSAMSGKGSSFAGASHSAAQARLTDGQIGLLEAQKLQIEGNTAFQAAETKRIIDSLPAFIKSLQGDAARKGFGKDTLERGEKNMNDFWKFLETLGAKSGNSAYDVKEKSSDLWEKFKNAEILNPRKKKSSGSTGSW